jgi:signal transduction histidine kinase
VQVFLNLILNAIDATDRDGRVELAVARVGDGALVTVRDTGCGIAREHAGRLFQPYFTTKKYGTGLGLFVTQRLVTDHGGTVSFESAPGQGTTFRVWLPLEESARRPAEADRESVPW